MNTFDSETINIKKYFDFNITKTSSQQDCNEFFVLLAEEFKLEKFYGSTCYGTTCLTCGFCSQLQLGYFNHLQLFATKDSSIEDLLFDFIGNNYVEDYKCNLCQLNSAKQYLTNPIQTLKEISSVNKKKQRKINKIVLLNNEETMKKSKILDHALMYNRYI